MVGLKYKAPPSTGDRPVVALITSSFPRFEGDPSGHFVEAHARALAREGARVVVIAPGPKAKPPLRTQESASDAASTDIEVARAGGERLFQWPGAPARARQNPLRLWGAFEFVSGARRALASLERVDRIVAHWIVPCAFPVVVYASPLAAGRVHKGNNVYTRAPLDVVAHGGDVRLLCQSPAAVRNAVIAALLERGARFQFVAHPLLDVLCDGLGLAAARALRAASRCEPAPIDVPNVEGAARVLRERNIRAAPSTPTVVCVARLVREKRVDLAILAAARAGARLVIIGDGPERSALQSLAASLRSHVAFTGALPRIEALTWIAAADVLVHPSIVEGAPTVVREARALCTPVVACAGGDVKRWAESDAAIHVVDHNADAIAAGIQRAVLCVRKSDR
ncbi:MAG: glycosyltransferase [Polyangiaceae bacterium]|nr:glycosyltransferase [Polyangiaceae bacterium]